jgi:tRNA(Ile2) C34 agmatinyltransferase TiaS
MPYFRFCKRCEKTFNPTGKYNFHCEKCRAKINKEKVIRQKATYKRRKSLRMANNKPERYK